MRTLSAAAKQAALAQQTGEVFVILMRISHPNFAQDILLSSDPTQVLPIANVRGTVSNGEEYVYLPFTIQLPQQDGEGISRAKVQIDNIDRRMVEAVRTADSSLSVDVSIVLASQPDIIEVSIPDFKIEHVTYDALTISGDLSLEYYDLEPFPHLRFTPSNFPGMF